MLEYGNLFLIILKQFVSIVDIQVLNLQFRMSPYTCYIANRFMAIV